MDAVISHQNVRLSRGRHRSPDEGACVMELVSMLAGERFSDRPRTACRVIGAFLRAYNDLAPATHRQDLLACASQVVGSRRPELERPRVRRCVEVAIELSDTQPRWRRVIRGDEHSRLQQIAEGPLDNFALRDLGFRLARLIRCAPDGRARVLALIEELVAMGAPEALPVPAAPAPGPAEPVAGG